jgi:acyl-[acyl-carrier-protein]-phospholipid O-acyltransferase/long-chain-fatty-acid--[acyl-carrier-protein] ligase
MKESKSFKSCLWLLGTNSLVSLNDNLAKYVVLGLCGVLMSVQEYQAANSSLAMILVLPYVMFAPLAGWVADRFGRRRVLGVAVLAQFVGLGVMTLAFWRHSFLLAQSGLFLLGVQSIFFSPAKYGFLKDLVGHAHLGLALAWMELLIMMAVLMGGFAGGLLFSDAAKAAGDPWVGALWVMYGIAGCAALSWLILQGTPAVPEEKRERPRFHFGILVGHFNGLAENLGNPRLRMAMLGFAWFLGLAWLVLLCLGVVAKGIAEPEDVAKLTGLFSLYLGLGTILGSGFTGFLNMGRVELGTVALGATGIVVSLLVSGMSVGLGWVGSPDVVWVFHLALVMLGFSGAVFSVPLKGYLLDTAGEERRGRVMAASTLLSNLFGLAFIGLHYLLLKAGVTAWQQLLWMAAPSVLVMGYVLYRMPEALFRTLMMMATRVLYRMKVTGLQNIPETGGALLVANHVSYADPVLIGAACSRKVRFIGFSGLTRSPLLRFVFKVCGVIPVSPENAREAITKASDAIADGEVVCIFPEGAITRTGGMQGLKRGFELIARRAKAPVIPVTLDGMWGSVFSYERNRFFRKTPLRLPYPVTIGFGELMSTETANSAAARQSLMDLAEHSFSQRPVLQSHLGFEIFKGLKALKSQEILVDRTKDRNPVQADILLAMSLAYAERLSGLSKSARVGIALPPGTGATIANLACVFAGKVPVNLNFSLGSSALESCILRSGMDALVTAGPILKKVPVLQSAPNVLEISEELKQVSKVSIGLRLAISRYLPSGMSARILGVPKKGGDKEAALIFTSGSSGEPKGVVLSHRNLLGNLTQISDCNLLDKDNVILGNLPLFHSFGFLVTLWYPLLKGVKIVTVPSPLEVNKSITAIKEEKVTVLLGTPTFLRPILRKAGAEDLASVYFAIAGAERTPTGMAEKWEEKFDCKWLEGYGLTETSPVISINLPDPPDADGQVFEETGRRHGTTGRPLPGVALRFVGPETGEDLPYGQTGILKVRGANVFGGYLADDDRTADVLKDGWFTTGDLARLDEDGFLHIEGRMSRFSKIGGEMVPHGTVEEAILEVLEVGEMDMPVLAVAGREDEAKGESLVLLTSFECDPAVLREKLSAVGLANLWIPKVVKQVPSIPVLPTGKLDLKGIKDLADGA